MRFLCHRLLSERGEASQTAIAQEIIAAYNSMKPDQRPAFFEILSREFSPDEADVRSSAPGTHSPHQYGAGRNGNSRHAAGASAFPTLQWLEFRRARFRPQAPFQILV
jgi:hypothetical protein